MKFVHSPTNKKALLWNSLPKESIPKTLVNSRYHYKSVKKTRNNKEYATTNKTYKKLTTKHNYNTITTNDRTKRIKSLGKFSEEEIVHTENSIIKSNSYFNNVTINPTLNPNIIKEVLCKQARKIREVIKKKLEKNVVNRIIIEESFNELIRKDPLFGDILKIIKKYYDNLLNEILKEQNKKLSIELATMKNKYEKQIEELKLQNEMKEKKHLEDIDLLKEENAILKYEVKRLELERIKERNKFLANIFKYKDTFFTNNKVGEIEVGKNKVRIPKLNLSELNYTKTYKDSLEIANDEDESSVN